VFANSIHRNSRLPKEAAFRAAIAAVAMWTPRQQVRDYHVIRRLCFEFAGCGGAGFWDISHTTNDGNQSVLAS